MRVPPCNPPRDQRWHPGVPPVVGYAVGKRGFVNFILKTWISVIGYIYVVCVHYN